MHQFLMHVKCVAEQIMFAVAFAVICCDDDQRVLQPTALFQRREELTERPILRGDLRVVEVEQRPRLPVFERRFARTRPCRTIAVQAIDELVGALIKAANITAE